MKLCHENSGAAVYVGRASTLHNLCFNVHTTVKYLNRNVSIWSVAPTHFKIYCGLCTVKAKNANKNI